MYVQSGSLIPLIFAAIVGKCHTANWSMGSERFAERRKFLNQTQQRLQLGTDFSKNWGFSKSEDVSEVTFVSDPNDFRTLKYRQRFCGMYLIYILLSNIYCYYVIL